MGEQGKLILKLSARYGLATGVMLFLAMLVFYYVQGIVTQEPIILLLDVLTIAMFLFLSMREFKFRYNGGELRFYHGMSIGFTLYIVGIIAYSVLFVLFVELVATDFVDQYIIQAREFLLASKDANIEELGAESFNKQLEQLPNTKVSTLALDAAIRKLLVGFGLAPILSIALRTNQR